MNPYSHLVSLLHAGTPCSTALVLSAEGSTPREAGVRAVVEGDGRTHGTIGGGAAEAEAQRAAVEACRTGRALTMEVELAGESAGGREPLCGGRMRVLIDPTAAKDRAAYAQATEALAARHRGVLLTAILPGEETRTQVRWVAEDEVADLPQARAARECLADGRTRLLAGEAEVLVEPVLPDPLLVIAGGGHIGQALAKQAVLIGFEVLVIDDRPQFTDPALFPPETRARCGDIAETLRSLPTAEDTCIVIVTRGHQHDAEALRACLGRPFAYVGMIGSRRKVALLRRNFVEAGIATEGELDAVHAPIGLDIGAETVPEIATAIAAQLVAVRRRGVSGRTPRDMRDR